MYQNAVSSFSYYTSLLYTYYHTIIIVVILLLEKYIKRKVDCHEAQTLVGKTL